MNSAAGCPSFSMPALWRWSDANSVVLGIFYIALGSILIQFGPTHDKFSLIAIATFGMGTFVLVTVHAFILPNSTPMWMVWISVLMALGIGAGAGYGVYEWPKIGVISIGISLGTIFGLLIYIMFMSNITGNVALELGMQTNSTTTAGGTTRPMADIEAEEWTQLMVSVICCILLFSAVSIVFYEQAVIIGTCVIGSYLVVRGIAKMLGNFPNEFLVYDSIKN